MVAKGTREIILIAQDLTYYGLDLYKKRNLSELMARLSDIEGLDWIRLQYAYPAGFPMDVIEVMAERPNICKYLDMPLQHGSSEMLKKMRRGIDRPKTERLLDAIREKIPDIHLRTTLIVGHPGETEAMFEEMYRFVEAQRFERLGVFQYSHEEDTHSHSFEDDVTPEEKQEILEMLNLSSIQSEFESISNLDAFFFRIIAVLYEKYKDNNICIDRMLGDKPNTVPKWDNFNQYQVEQHLKQLETVE